MAGLPKIYPVAKRIYTPDKPGIGPFSGVNPRGITVHYTASGSADSALTEEQKGLGYHVLIDRDGSVIQTCYFDLRVYHAGKALWNNLSPNMCHIAVAVVSWGVLDDEGRTYTKKKLPENEVVEWNGKKWHKATFEQEKSLKSFLTWAVHVGGILPKNICGHDECALPPGRKPDPGGILSFSMSDFRSTL